MIFVDSNVYMYAVGKPHPLRTQAQAFFVESRKGGNILVTSAEVLQELIHVYLPVGRLQTLDHALELATQSSDRIFPIDSDAVLHARALSDQYPGLTARDLIHLSICQLHAVAEIKSFDRSLVSAFKPR